MRNPWKLILSLALPQLVGLSAALYTASAVSGWYKDLLKPPFNPPAWLFAPAWTLLYILMGIALYLVWRAPKSWARDRAISYWLAQLFLNFLWTAIFFKFMDIRGALIEIVFLWLAILVTIITMRKVSKTAFWLMLPYLIWVSFAAYLNWGIWMLN